MTSNSVPKSSLLSPAALVRARLRLPPRSSTAQHSKAAAPIIEYEEFAPGSESWDLASPPLACPHPSSRLSGASSTLGTTGASAFGSVGGSDEYLPNEIPPSLTDSVDSSPIANSPIGGGTSVFGVPSKSVNSERASRLHRTPLKNRTLASFMSPELVSQLASSQSPPEEAKLSTRPRQDSRCSFTEDRFDSDLDEDIIYPDSDNLLSHSHTQFTVISSATGASELQDMSAKTIREQKRLSQYGRQVVTTIASLKSSSIQNAAHPSSVYPPSAPLSQTLQGALSPNLRRRGVSISVGISPSTPQKPLPSPSSTPPLPFKEGAGTPVAGLTKESTVVSPPFPIQQASLSDVSAPPPPIPLFGISHGSRIPQKYRPSNALNEDSFDFAIIVSAEINESQANALSNAKAVADALMAFRGGAPPLPSTKAPHPISQSPGKRILSSGGAMGTDSWYDDWDEEALIVGEDGKEDGDQKEKEGDDYDNEKEDDSVGRVGEVPLSRTEGVVLEVPPLSSDKRLKKRSSVFATMGKWTRGSLEAFGQGLDSLFRDRAGDLGATADFKLKNQQRGQQAPPPATPSSPLASPTRTCSEVLAALRAAGLTAERVRSLSRRTWLIKVLAPEWRLELEAEKLRLRLRRVDGGWSRFRRCLRHAFLMPHTRAVLGESNVEASLFHSSDRQGLIDRILRSSWREGGADLGVTSPLGPFIKDMFPLHMHARLEELRSDLIAPWRPPRALPFFDRIGVVDESWYASPHLEEIGIAQARNPEVYVKSKIVEGPPPSITTCPPSSNDSPSSLYYSRALSHFRGLLIVRFCFSLWLLGAKAVRSTSRLLINLFVLPLDRIAAYFGETTAFYFAWCQFYTSWLITPAILGVALFLAQLWWGTLETSYSPLYTMCMAVWSIVVLELWRRREAELAQRWGVDQYEEEEAMRPGFVGDWKVNAESGELTRVYAPWKRFLTYTITIPATFICTGGVIVSMTLLFSARDHVLAQLSRHVGLEKIWAAVHATPSVETAIKSGTLPSPPLLTPLDLPASLSTAWRAGVSGFMASPTQAWVPSSEIPPSLLSAITPALKNAGWVGDTLGTSAASPNPPSYSFTYTNTGSSSPTIDVGVLSSYFTARGDWRWWLVMCLPPIALGLTIPLLDSLFFRFARYATDAENHATESASRNAMISKTFLFRFTVSFISLFWYAFSPSASITQLAVQLATYFFVVQVIGTVAGGLTQACCIRYREWVFAARLRGAEDSGLTEGKRGKRLMQHALSAPWRESRLPRYDPIYTYSTLLIQWGHVTFFSWAFPLAPAAALLFNLVDMRVRAYRLCKLYQRPVAHKAGGIGVWHNVLIVMALSAVLVNCAQLARSSGMLDAYLPSGLTESQKLLLVFIFEHMVLGLRLALPYLFPAISERVHRRQVRDDHLLAKLQVHAAAEAGKNGGLSILSPRPPRPQCQ